MWRGGFFSDSRPAVSAETGTTPKYHPEYIRFRMFAEVAVEITGNGAGGVGEFQSQTSYAFVMRSDAARELAGDLMKTKSSRRQQNLDCLPVFKSHLL